MSLESVRNLVPLTDEDMVPPPGLFVHPSYLHGQAHVARVMVHALRLIDATGAASEAPRLWAAVYLHDIARRHDGGCRRHGADAWARLASLPDVQARFLRAGVRSEDHPAIEAARTMVPFAQRIYDETNGVLKPGLGYFGRLWSEVGRILVDAT